MRSDVLNQSSGSYYDLNAGDKGVIELGTKKIQTFVGSLASITAGTTQYSDNDIMQYLGALDVSVPDGFHTPSKIVIEKVAFSCNTASGGTHVGNLQLSATANSAENGAVTTGTEIVGAGATYVNTGLNATEADLDFNAAGLTLVQSGVVVATSLINLYACTTTTLDGDFTAGRYTVQVEYSVL
tara:strand:- start:334 stop:885 length:552 start_codon:yes stop_codon:yes gene_type:complete